MRIIYIVDIDSKITEFSNLDAAVEFLVTYPMVKGETGYVIDCLSGRIKFRRSGHE